MRRIIAHLRTKPDHHKRTIVLVVSLGITALVFLIWLSFVKVEFASIDSPQQVADNPGPLVFIKENVANAYNSIKSDLGSIKYQAPQ